MSNYYEDQLSGILPVVGIPSLKFKVMNSDTGSSTKWLTLNDESFEAFTETLGRAAYERNESQGSGTSSQE